jgi:hypothetical protein
MRIPYKDDFGSVGSLSLLISKQVGSKKWKSLVHMVFLATCWKIWLARNNLVFNNMSISVPALVESIKIESFFWLCNRSRLRPISWDQWRSFDLGSIV